MKNIVLKDLSKSYEGAENEVILDKINLEISSGDFISISGHSGIGKSTLLYLIGGLIKPSSGAVYYGDRSLASFKPKEMDEFRRNVMSFIFQEYQFVQSMNLMDNLMLSCKLNSDLSGLKLEATIDEYLNRLNLFDRKLYRPSMLSGGQKRRAMFLSGILKKSEYILMDEPTNDLDEKMERELLDIMLEEKNKGRGIILVTHNVEIAATAERKYSLVGGKLTEL